MKYTKSYEPPILTVDSVIFQVHTQVEVLLQKREHAPFQGTWALPGDYSSRGETTLEALERIVFDKAGVSLEKDLQHTEQLFTFDTVARDPRGHAVSITYLSCGVDITPKTRYHAVQFFPINELPDLAFDHKKIIDYALGRIQSKLGYSTIVRTFLPNEFTFSQLQSTYEIVLSKPLDKRNFRKKIQELDIIEETGNMWRQGAHRPAKLYRFKGKSVTHLENSFR